MIYSKYYEEVLYPIQNEVLKCLKQCKTPFYLTGGTALGRGYFKHRYSDDLDLFVNNIEIERYGTYVESIVLALKQNGFDIDFSQHQSPSFRQIYINRNKNGLDKNGLKIDFVNDIEAHFGDITETPIYYRTDSIRNILSNKYTALYRMLAKDIVDICEIAKHISFNWADILSEANEKEIGIDAKDVSEIFKSISDDDLLKIKWTKTPNITKLRQYMNTVACDILKAQDNSIYKVIKKTKEPKYNGRDR